MNLKIHSLFRKKEQILGALSILDPQNEKLRKFREYFREELNKVQQEIDKMIEENNGVIK